MNNQLSEKKLAKASQGFISSSKRGFTLVEMLVVIGLIALLSTVVLVAVNPSRQFKMARDTQRTAHISAILNALSQNMAENKGQLVCEGIVKDIPSSTTEMRDNEPLGDFAPCIVPAYLASMPFDPSESTAFYDSPDDYDTGYTIRQDSSGHITLTAPSEISTSSLTVTR